jgi:hypothetical protein
MSNAAKIEAKQRFFDAQRRATREDVLARLLNRPRDLLPYEEVARVLRSYEHLQLTELREIPLDKIVGSVGRYRDFTRSFMPRKGIRPDRWAGIDLMMQSPEGLRPIEVYQLGDVYFVADGNHRVSVALANEATHMEAWVTTIPVNPDIQPGDTLDQAIIKAECAHFLAQTRLAERCGASDLAVTRPGAYPRLLEQIYAYRALAGRPIAFAEAAAQWHVDVYQPVARHITEARLLEKFPGRTVTDLYVWLVERLAELKVDSTTVVRAELSKQLARESRTQLSLALERIVERLAPLSTGAED